MDTIEAERIPEPPLDDPRFSPASPLNSAAPPAPAPAARPPAQPLGVPAATMPGLSIAERLDPGTPTPKLAAAVAQVIREMTWVEKRGVNEFHRYKYATADDIRSHVGKLLGKHGLTFTQQEVSIAPLDRYIALTYAFRLYHESGEHGPPELVTVLTMLLTHKGAPDDKAFSKAHVLALKDWLKGRFMVPAGDEPEADEPDHTPVDPPAPRNAQTHTPERAAGKLDAIAERNGAAATKPPARRRAPTVSGPEEWVSKIALPWLEGAKTLDELQGYLVTWEANVEVLRRDFPALHADVLASIERNTARLEAEAGAAGEPA
jgi:hypothetical protein